MTTDRRFQVPQLQTNVQMLFVAAGTPTHIARTVAEILVNANLAGHDSHGVQFVPLYLDRIENGALDPAAEPRIVQETANTICIDGQQCFGHYMCRQAMSWAIEKAKAHAVCSVTFWNGTHIGRLGEYAEQAARAGCIGIITTGIGTKDTGQVVPFGGAHGRLSTNPIAVGVPTGDDAPFIIDFATSVIAGGKIMVARSKEADLPAGAIVDKEGNPSVKTTDFYDGGSLLPAGGHKGYALALLTCLLGGLSGQFEPDQGDMGGPFMQVIDVEALTPLAAYELNVRTFLDGMKATPPAPGFDEVLVPGDFEYRSRVRRREKGIDVPEATHKRIQEWAEKLNVALDD